MTDKGPGRLGRWRVVGAVGVFILAALVAACDESPPAEIAQPAIARCAETVWTNASSMTMPTLPDWMSPKANPDLKRVGDAASAVVKKLGQEKVTEAIRAAARARKGDGNAIDIAGVAPLIDGFRLEFSCTVEGDKVTAVKHTLVTGS